MLSIGTSDGANKPFLALVVLDLGNLLGEYGIEVANFNSAGNKKAHRRSATDHQVERAAKRRLIDGDLLVSTKSPSTALGKDHHGRYINVTATGWVPRQPPLLEFSCK